MDERKGGFENRRILITGGLGFIGANLARRLVTLGARVTLVDSLIPEYGGNLYNIDGLSDRVTVNISDVRDAHSMRYLVQGHEILFNLAGQTSHMDSMSEPETDLEINCRAQLSILEACRKYQPAMRIVFASTRQIYGKPDYLPVDEKHLVRPVDVNGVNKAAGEAYHILYSNVYGLHCCVLRLTNTIGPRMRIKDARQTFLGVWIRCLCEGRPFEVWGGEQRRDFNYVEDVIDAFLAAAGHEAAKGMTFNLGSTEVITLKALADTLIALYGGGSYVVKEYPSDRKRIDIGDYYSDYSSIRSALGWTPKTSLREALSQTLDYYRQHTAHYV